MSSDLIPTQTPDSSVVENPVTIAIETALGLLRQELLLSIGDQMTHRDALFHRGDSAAGDIRYALEQALIRVEFINNLIATGIVLLELQSGKEGAMLWPALQLHQQAALFAVTKQADILVGGGEVGRFTDYEAHVINSFAYAYKSTRILVN